MPENLHDEFDIVFTSYGALCWLPDMTEWAEVVAHFVKPGGTFYLAEFHPMSMIFDDDPGVTDLNVRYPYFPEYGPVRVEEEATYADRSANVENKLTFDFPHPVGEVLTALIEVGLRIEFLHEFPFSTYQFLPFTEVVAEKTVRLTKHDGSIPLLYSIKGTMPV